MFSDTVSTTVKERVVYFSCTVYPGFLVVVEEAIRGRKIRCRLDIQEKLSLDHLEEANL